MVFMPVHRLITWMLLPMRRDEVFNFFADATNLERITPPELQFEIVTPPPIQIGQGSLIDYRLRLLGVPFRWQTQIALWRPPHEFVDIQLHGPYRLWEHTHRFRDHGAGTIIEDVVRYQLPVSPFGELAHPLLRLRLNHIFQFREDAVRSWVADQQAVTTVSK